MYHTPKAAPWPGGKYIRRRTHTAAIYIESEKQNLSNELTPIAYICISINTIPLAPPPLKKN